MWSDLNRIQSNSRQKVLFYVSFFTYLLKSAAPRSKEMDCVFHGKRLFPWTEKTNGAGKRSQRLYVFSSRSNGGDFSTVSSRGEKKKKVMKPTWCWMWQTKRTYWWEVSSRKTLQLVSVFVHEDKIKTLNTAGHSRGKKQHLKTNLHVRSLEKSSNTRRW